MNNSKIIKKDLEEEETIEDIEDIEEDLEHEEEKIEAPKKKKVLNENQKKAVAINLAKGRDNLKKKQEQQKLDRKNEQKNYKCLKKKL